MRSRIPKSDREFLQCIITLYRIPLVKLEFNESDAAWPDCWCYPNEKPPRIVVTQEWARQGVDERRKRLIHEISHILGERHGKKGKLVYSTDPAKDSYSKYVYDQIKWR